MTWLRWFREGRELQRASLRTRQNIAEILSTWPEVEGPQANRLDRARLVEHMSKKNPVRWARFVNDFRYFQKQMKKLGRNPEDVRFLLP